LRDVVEKCTEWDRDTVFGSWVQHQNIVENPSFEMGGGVSVKSGEYYEQHVPRSVEVRTTPSLDGEMMRVGIVASDRMVSDGDAKKLVGRMCDTHLGFFTGSRHQTTVKDSGSTIEGKVRE
jgi:hypothetical protein